MEKEIINTIKILKKGGLILYPTDTIWGIGCDATNADAIKKIYLLKKRENSKSLISLVANKEQLYNYTKYIPKEAFNVNPTTIIYTQISGFPKNLLAEDGSLAIRIVQDEFCREVINRFGKPIVSTSANISNFKSPKKFSEISKKIIYNVDYLVSLRKDEIMQQPSTILKLNNNSTLTKIR